MTETGINELALGVEGIDIPLSYSNRILSQFSGSGADPYAINFARLICVPYKVAASGERAFNTALTNLPVFPAHAAEPRLQFGWAEEYLLRNKDVHLYGYEHLVLCAALVEGGFSEAYAAGVLTALADQFEDVHGEGREGGMRVKPHFQSWKGLMHADNGVLTSSELAQVVDDRVRLNPYGDDSGHGSAGEASRVIPPKELANAVHAVGEMAGGVGGKKEVLLIGGDVLGWFAATGEWLLNLNVKVEDVDGKVLHEFHSGHEGLLRLVFVPNVGDDTSSLEKFGDCLRLIGTTNEPTPRSGSLIPFTGRTTWEALLPKVFGKYFHQLSHAESRATANALGGIARAFELAAKNKCTPEEFVSLENRENSAAWGIGLVTTMCNWFPELRHLQGRMERVQKQDQDEINTTCMEAAHHLEELCKCDICHKDSTKTLSKSEFCLPTIMETIATLALAMSRITVIPKVYPSRAGILCIYHSQVGKRRKVRELPPHPVTGERHKLIFGYEWNAPYTRRLRAVAAIFTGSWPHTDLPDNLVALSHEGICAYMLKLHDSTAGGRKKSALESDTIRVTTGNICWKQKIYSRACLGPVTPPARLEAGWEELRCAHLEQRLYCK